MAELPPDGSRLVRLQCVRQQGATALTHLHLAPSHRLLRPDCRRPVCMPTYSDARMARVHLDSAVGRALALQPSPNGLTLALPHTSVHHHLPNVPIGTSSIPVILASESRCCRRQACTPARPLFGSSWTRRVNILSRLWAGWVCSRAAECVLNQTNSPAHLW